MAYLFQSIIYWQETHLENTLVVLVKDEKNYLTLLDIVGITLKSAMLQRCDTKEPCDYIKTEMSRNIVVVELFNCALFYWLDWAGCLLAVGGCLPGAVLGSTSSSPCLAVEHIGLGCVGRWRGENGKSVHLLQQSSEEKTEGTSRLTELRRVKWYHENTDRSSPNSSRSCSPIRTT